MNQELSQLHDIFSRSMNRVKTFMDMLSPAIDTAQGDHERLYYHHIFEEEEQRMGRLEQLVPSLTRYIGQDETIQPTGFPFISLLQDINLEKFGLHNFLEHLDLALFHFTDEERSSTLKSMLNETKSDYVKVKEILLGLNEKFLPEAQTSLTKSSDQHRVATAAHDDDHDHDHNHHHHDRDHDHHHHVNDHDHEHGLHNHSSSHFPLPAPRIKGLSVGSLKQFR